MAEILRKQLLDTSRSRVVRLLQEAGLTADDIASKLGLTPSAVNLLRDGFDIYVDTQEDANDPERRDYAIQRLGEFMRRSFRDGPHVKANPAFSEAIGSITSRWRMAWKNGRSRGWL